MWQCTMCKANETSSCEKETRRLLNASRFMNATIVEKREWYEGKNERCRKVTFITRCMYFREAHREVSRFEHFFARWQIWSHYFRESVSGWRNRLTKFDCAHKSSFSSGYRLLRLVKILLRLRGAFSLSTRQRSKMHTHHIIARWLRHE